MSVYIKNETPLDGPSLCETCAYSCIARGYRESEQTVVCQATTPERLVAFRVRECSRFIDKSRQTLWEMRKMAWVLAPKGSKRHAGFLRPGEAGADEGENEDD